jgi:hypothetical protein
MVDLANSFTGVGKKQIDPRRAGKFSSIRGHTIDAMPKRGAHRRFFEKGFFDTRGVLAHFGRKNLKKWFFS